MVELPLSPFIYTAQASSYASLVLDNSQQGPVLVNFCSSGMGACQRQTMLLEKIIQHYDGKVLLVNIDPGSERQLCEQLGVTEVPTIKLYRHQAILETRVGLQSEEQLVLMLEPHIARDSDLVLADAIELYTQGQAQAAYEKIAGAIAEDPLNPRLPLTMAKLLKHEARYTEALKLLRSLPELHQQYREIALFQDELSFYESEDHLRDISLLQEQATTEPGNLQVKQQLVNYYVVQGNYQSGLEMLQEILEQDSGFDDNFPQKASLRIFNILGSTHPLVSEYRGKLLHYTH